MFFYWFWVLLALGMGIRASDSAADGDIILLHLNAYELDCCRAGEVIWKYIR